MEYPPLPIPDTVGHYGQNGIAFEGICGHFYGFVEYEKELPASDVAVFNLVPGPSPSYYPIDEETARRAHEMMSFRDYKKGAKTSRYGEVGTYLCSNFGLDRQAGAAVRSQQNCRRAGIVSLS